MKKVLIALLLTITSSQALAHGPGYGYGYHGHNDWVVPLIVGGAVGYLMAQPRVVYVTPPPRVISVESVYQYMWITDPQCGCQKQVLIQVTN